MSRYLVWSFRFLSPWFHGRGDGGAPEWPPSPLRAFQAVVAAAGRAGTLDSVCTSLKWLEQCAAPQVLASLASDVEQGYLLSVPHNAMDLVGKQWTRGDEGNAAEHRTMKGVRPQHLPEGAVVHYVWLVDDESVHLPALVSAPRGVVALGWGVDLVVGHGAVLEAAELAGLSSGLRVWKPRRSGGRTLRVPIQGTLDDLTRRHEAFLDRASFADPTLRPPPPLSAFEIAAYASDDQPCAAEVAAFALMRVDSDNFRAFETRRRGMAVSGMLRHAVRLAALGAGWDEARVNSTVLGHGEGVEPRLFLVPVPSIEPRGQRGEVVGAVRRVMVFSSAPDGDETNWARRALGGRDLIDEDTGEVQAVLAQTGRDDRVLQRYIGTSAAWATVTPVILPGYDDPGGLRERLRKKTSVEEQRGLLERLMKRREALIRKALRNAGVGDELAFTANIEVRDSGFFAGVDRAATYVVPSHLSKAIRYHVKLTWPTKVTGPLCIGNGRFSGMGLFATMSG